MATDAPLNQAADRRKRQIALERVTGFVQEHSEHAESYLALACHAALPVALTPDLVYQIWARFTPDAPWTAVADLLLSRLCQEGGYELYAMDTAVRDVLLQELAASFGAERITRLSEFVRQYFARQRNTDDPDERAFAESQHWTALAYVNADAAAGALLDAAQRIPDSGQPDTLAETLRLYALIDSLSTPLAQRRTQLLNALPAAFRAAIRQSSEPSETAADVTVTRRYLRIEIALNIIQPSLASGAQTAPPAGGEIAVRVIQSPAGAMSENEAELVSMLDVARRIARALQPRTAELGASETIAAGEALGRTLFPPRARTLFDQCRAMLGERDVLRIHLRSSDYALLSFPWEVTRLAEENFLLQDRRISLVRRVAGSMLPALRPGNRRPLRMVAALSSPAEMPSLDLPAIERLLSQSLEGAPGIALELIQNATPHQLADALSKPAEIVQLACRLNATYTNDPAGATLAPESPALTLNNDEGLIQFAGIDQFDWRASRSRLVILNQTPDSAPEAVALVAVRLIALGVPAVLAAPAAMTDRAAVAFYRAVYTALADGSPIEDAVIEGRQAIHAATGPDSFEWALPALYSNGELVMLPPASASAEPQPASARPALIVIDSVGTSGLRLRAEPNVQSATLSFLPAGAQLELLDPANMADVGQAGKWLNVRAPDGQAGFVAANFVRSAGATPGDAQPKPASSARADDVRDVLVALSLFPAPATEQAICHVAGLLDDPQRAGAAINQLREQQQIAPFNSDRVALTGPAYQRATEQLAADSALARAFQQRFIDYYAQLAQAAVAPSPAAESTMAHERFNLLAALDAARDMQDWANLTLIAQAVAAYSPIIFPDNATDDAVRRFDQAVYAAQQTGDLNRVASFLVEKAAHLMLRDRTMQAIQPLQQALEVCRQAGDRRAEAGALRNLGLAYRQLGDPKRAIDLYQQAVALSESLADAEGEIAGLAGLAQTQEQIGDLAVALESAERTLALQEKTGQAPADDLVELATRLRRALRNRLAGKS